MGERYATNMPSLRDWDYDLMRKFKLFLISRSSLQFTLFPYSYTHILLTINAKFLHSYTLNFKIFTLASIYILKF